MINISPLELLGKGDINKNIHPDEVNFGNVDLNKLLMRNVNLNARSVARWAYLFGKDLLTFNYDYLEPDYLKNFIFKGR